RGEGPHLVEVDLGVVADAALVWPARAVVLDAVPTEGLELAVLHPHGNLNRELAVATLENGPEVVAQVDGLGRPREEEVDGFERGERVVGGHGEGHSYTWALGNGV